MQLIKTQSKTIKNFSTSSILQRLINLDQEMQRLKMDIILTLPVGKVREIYPQKEIDQTINNIRESIWQKNYAKKIKNIS